MVGWREGFISEQGGGIAAKVKKSHNVIEILKLIFVFLETLVYFAFFTILMSVLIIKGSDSNQKLILALAKKIGSQAMSLKNEQLEDMLFGIRMDEEKTNTLVSREEIFKALKHR